MRGLGTIINVVAILVGASLGVVIGHRLPARKRRNVTDALGLVTLGTGALKSAAPRDDAPAAVSEPSLARRSGTLPDDHPHVTVTTPAATSPTTAPAGA